MEVLDHNHRIVDFNDYCPKCKHSNVNENEYPCDECLDNPVNEGTDKPVKFEKKEWL